MIDTLIYDGTFEGFLTTVFHVYEHRLANVKISRSLPSVALFGKSHTIHTNEAQAARVWTGLTKKMSKDGLHNLYCSFLADTLMEEDNMLAVIRHVLANENNVENDFSNFGIMRLHKVERMVHRESHRMKAFIRFKLTKDQIYYAAIEPDFDVIPLIRSHFTKRYADQRWIIYDLRRDYGIYYDLSTVEVIKISFAENEKGMGNSALSMDENEVLFQTLWQQYFKSTNIQTRKNMKLHIQHMPRRYWKYLLEKHIHEKKIL